MRSLTAAEYMQRCEECLKWAQQASANDVRAHYLKLADIWLKAASRVSRAKGEDIRSA